MSIVNASVDAALGHVALKIFKLNNLEKSGSTIVHLEMDN